MKLERLALENFRQYAGRHELEFAPPGPANVTLIRGLNGAGKTHLLEALHWCLYGGLSVEELRDTVSKGQLADSSPGEQFPLAVELFFEHAGLKYRAKRSARVRVHPPAPDQGLTFSVPGDDFSLHEIEPNGNAREISAPREEIAAILPRDAAQYFFFDGERIDKFARPDNALGIQKAVDQVLKFAYLDRAIAHIKDVRLDYEAELRRLAAGTEIEGFLSQKAERESERGRIVSELERIPREIEQVRAQKTVVENALLEMEIVRDKMLRRQAIRGELESLRTRGSAQVDRIADTLPLAHLVFARAAITRTLEDVNSKRKRGEIPSRVRQVVVKDLLEAGQCICGRLLDHGSPEYEAIRALSERSVSSRLEERVISAATSLPGLIQRAGGQSAKLADAVREHHDIERQMKGLQESLTELDEDLRSARQEEVKDLVDKNKRLEKDLQDLALRHHDASRSVAEFDRVLGVLDSQIEKGRRQSSQVDALRRRAVIAREAEQALNQTRSRFADEVRSQVEAGTSEMFKRLVWKESHFDRVVVSEAFGLSVIDRWGGPALGDLSAGETEVLSLSFIVTMGRVAGEAIEEVAPVVIDTPFGRLSTEPRENIARILPNLVEQLVLLVTDTELVATEEAIIPKVGRRYNLDFDPTTSCTSIVEVSAHG